MKIDSTNSSRLQPAQSDAARVQQGGSAAATDSASAQAGSATDASTSATASGADSNVSLSSLSSQLRSLAASGSADIDTAQVESIKSAIRNGTLQIDTGKIADGVLATARSLLTPSSGA